MPAVLNSRLMYACVWPLHFYCSRFESRYASFSEAFAWLLQRKALVVNGLYSLGEARTELLRRPKLTLSTATCARPHILFLGA